MSISRLPRSLPWWERAALWAPSLSICGVLEGLPRVKGVLHKSDFLCPNQAIPEEGRGWDSGSSLPAALVRRLSRAGQEEQEDLRAGSGALTQGLQDAGSLLGGADRLEVQGKGWVVAHSRLGVLGLQAGAGHPLFLQGLQLLH